MHVGMPVRIVLHADTDSLARAAARAAFARIAELDNTFSDYRSQSEVRRMEARAGEWVPVSADLFEVLGRSLAVAQLSEGAFDPTVAPVVALWREARKTKTLPSHARLDSARALVGWRRVRLDSVKRAVRLEPGMRLDFGGIAKGYIINEARASLRRAGVSSMLIEAGGDIVVGSPPPGESGWRIDARNASSKFKERLLSVTDAAVSTSGPTVQFTEIDGKRYSHVVDPRTGLALTSSAVIHVLAKDPALADAVATALSVLGVGERENFLARLPADVVVEVAGRWPPLL